MKTLIKTSLKTFCCLLLFFSSCKSKPTDEEVRQCVTGYYLQSSLQAGGGEYDVQKTEVLSLVPGDQEGEWKIRVRSKGNYANYSIADAVQEKFDETLNFKMFRNKAGDWECSVIYPDQGK